MKRIFYIILITLSASLTITSCTEEEIVPSADNGGGNGEPGKL